MCWSENLSVLCKRHLVRLNYVPLQARHLDQVVATTWNAALFLLVAVVSFIHLCVLSGPWYKLFISIDIPW